MEDKEYIKKCFGDAVRAARENGGLSQEALASRAGLDRTYIGGVERGERNPSLLSLNKIANGLGLTLAELFVHFSNISEGGE